MVKKKSNEPTTVKVGYRDIVIEWVSPEFKTDSMTDSYGEYKAREGKILIQNNLCGQEKSNVLFHEILHCVAYISGLNQANGPLKEDDAEEITVNSLTNFIMGVFRDNPWFLDYIKNNMNEAANDS